MQLAQADALIARGHRVRLVTTGLPLTWRSSRAEWIYVDDLRYYDAGDDDFVIGSFDTVTVAYDLAGERAVHLCQRVADAAHELPIPKLAVSRSLIPICERSGSDAIYIGQIVEDELYRDVTPREREPPRVLLSGAAQNEIKGIDDGYGAVAHARWFHQKLDLIRVSPWAPSREEPLESVQEFHVALNTAEMTRLVHSCDLLIAASHAEEGFGLPAAEAMAAGIPCLLTAIPSYLSFDDTRDYALFAPEQNAVELGERLIDLLGDAALRARLRTRAREVAEQWRAESVAERLESFFVARAVR